MESKIAETNARIDVVDVLRGLAVMGIIVLHSIEHFNFYSFPQSVPYQWMHFTDQAIWRGLFFTFGGKAYAVFALLFGFSFYIQDSNQQRRGKDFRLRFLWRMCILFAIGLFPLYGLNNMLPEFITRAATLAPLKIILSSLSNLSFMLMLVTGLLLTFYRVKDRSFFMRFTSYGKMSMTNYIGQSVIGSLLFYHWGFELGRYMGITYSFLFGIVFVLLQMAFCSWWMNHHKHGPFEGLWKRLTWIGKK